MKKGGQIQDIHGKYDQQNLMGGDGVRLRKRQNSNKKFLGFWPGLLCKG